MSVDEQKTMNRAENHARLVIFSLGMSVQTTVSHELRHREGYRSVSLVLVIVMNCLKRSTHDSDQDMATTSDNSPITERIRTNETPKCRPWRL